MRRRVAIVTAAFLAVVLTSLLGATSTRRPTPAPTGTIVGEVRVTEADGPRGDLSNVAVWLEGVPVAPDEATDAQRLEAPGEGASEFMMKSERKAFVPRVLLVPTGARVDFPNVDPIFHNVFSVSRPRRFDLGLYKNGASRDVVFDEEGLVRVYCNIHSTMVGFIRVVASEHRVLTDRSGRFTLDGLPPGSYTLRVWDEKAGEITKPVTVADAGEARVVVELDARRFAETPHLNKYGKPYKKGGARGRY